MLRKDVDWSIMAQCDSFAVERMVQTPDRVAMRAVEPISEAIFERKINKDEKWKNAYNALCTAYQNLIPLFSIRHDKFGGYCLCYAGKNVVKPPYFFRRNPIGFVRDVPEGSVTNLSVMSSERTGRQLLLLGPVRFVNSDCEPNCEYDFSSESGIIQLSVKKKINPGDELFVKYGPDFFDNNACLCRTCELRKAVEVENSIKFDIFLEELCIEKLKEVVDESTVQVSKTENSVCRSKKRRIKGRELVEMFNDLAEDPVNSFIPQESTTSASKKLILGNCVINIPSSDEFTNECLQSDESSFEDIELETPQSVENVSDQNVQTVLNSIESSKNDDLEDFSVIRASSPVLFDESFTFNLSLIGEENPIDSLMTFVASQPHFESLFDGSDITAQEASVLTDLFCSKFHCSDECAESLHSLVKVLLPNENRFPSGYSHVKGMKKQFADAVRVLTKTEDSTLCVMTFRFQIRDIFVRHFSKIFQYSEFRKHNPHVDFNTYLCPPTEIGHSNIINTNLVIFSDGVNIKKSTFKKELWPVWIQVADLPPNLRMARQNIVLAALFVGGTHPNWDTLVPHLSAELNTGIQFEMSDQVSYKILFKVRLLVSDLGAKSHMLNMFKFNGYYGCHFCTAKGKFIGRTHAYYPHYEEGQLRESSVTEVYVNMAEALSIVAKPNVVGVKGKSAFARIIDGLPLCAPIDYMHCVLLGVFPDLLKLCMKSLTAKSRDEVTKVVEKLSCPREVISYSRKIRPLAELSQFKANEYFNWLFYVSTIVFLKRLPTDIYSHLTNLVSGVRLLLESSCETNVQSAEFFLKQFCQQIVRFHGGNERIETINVHCLNHLPEQVRRCGPLFCQSAMSFEAANRTLGEVASGSNSECEVICRRILQRHKLCDFDPQNKNLMPLFCKLSGKRQTAISNHPNEFCETEALIAGRKKFPSAKFLNRIYFKHLYFDSPAYTRSKLGNCYVCFKDDLQIDQFGKIQLSETSNGNETLANVLHFLVCEEIGPVSGYFYRVQLTDFEELVPVKKLQKVFLLDNSSNEDSKSDANLYLVKLTSCFEHS